MRWLRAVTALAMASLAGCGAGGHSTAAPSSSTSSLPREVVLQARPIGQGPRFRPPVTGRPLGRCAGALGPRVGVHLEVFAANRVVLIASGIGTRPPRRTFAGRITGARCYGSIVTIDPTGLLLVRRGAWLAVADVFHSWGQPLTDTRLASFASAPGRSVAAFVDGRLWRGSPGSIRLTRHAEIVLEVGPHVPPHSSYTFPPGT